MKKVNQLFIATKRGNKYYYIAVLSADRSSVLIQRVTRTTDNYSKGNDPKSYHTVATFIEYDGYISSGIEIGEMQYDIACRIPTTEYLDEERNVPEKCRDYVIECKTHENNFFRVRMDDYDKDRDVFHNFVITYEKDGAELLAAIVEVDSQDELSVVLYGCPAGYEIS